MAAGLRTRRTGSGIVVLALVAGAVAGGASAASPAVRDTGAPASAARSFVIDARGSSSGLGRVLRIGDFRPQRDATVAAARAAFGRPSSRGEGRLACPISWRAIGVRILFANLGAGDSACAPRLGRAQVAIVRGRRWRTAKGLRVGATPRRLREVYPGADRVGARSYRIVTARGFAGVDRPYAVVSARLSEGRVSSFRLFVGAAGE